MVGYLDLEMTWYLEVWKTENKPAQNIRQSKWFDKYDVQGHCG